jgi:hypothetical protein
MSLNDIINPTRADVKVPWMEWAVRWFLGFWTGILESFRGMVVGIKAG